MIKVDGSKITLDGTDDVLVHELSFLLGTFRSRLASRGENSRYTDHLIDKAVCNASLYSVDYLRADARMYADSYKLQGARMGARL
jgi:hypothetical protein